MVWQRANNFNQNPWKCKFFTGQATPEKMQDVFELKPHVMGSGGDG
jgi:hypothetical protein